MTCNGDSTVLPTTFAQLTGTCQPNQLPTGLPMQASVVNLTAQAASIGATPLYAVITTGLYRISASIKRTQIATTSSTLPSVAITWTEGDNSAAGASTPIATNATNTLVATAASEVIVYAKAATNIQYTCAGYASSGATPMQYALRIKCEQL
jgi:hypothetical protein